MDLNVHIQRYGGATIPGLIKPIHRVLPSAGPPKNATCINLRLYVGERLLVAVRIKTEPR